MSGTLAGRRAIVTGAADGIGAAIVRTFVREGARVLAVNIQARVADGKVAAEGPELILQALRLPMQVNAW